jgi:hypothetical protein
MAEISAGLVGLFLIGVFFFIQTGFRRVAHGGDVAEVHIREGTRIVLLLFAIPIFVSLSLVALNPGWTKVVFVVLSLGLIAANIDFVVRLRTIDRSDLVLPLSITGVLGTIGSLLLVTLPWILGGFNPTREDFTWAILVAFLIGFISIGALVLAAFDLAHLEASEIVEDDDQPLPAETEPITETHNVTDQNGEDPGD